MRALIQRVSRCCVIINSQEVASINKGMLILLGIKNGDDESAAEYLAQRCSALRIFDDTEGRMNLSFKDVNGKVIVVSQFTLYGDTRKGNRPSYTEAAPPLVAEPLYDFFVKKLKEILGEQNVDAGIFRAMMEIELVNDGPVTVTVDSKN